MKRVKKELWFSPKENSTFIDMGREIIFTYPEDWNKIQKNYGGKKFWSSLTGKSGGAYILPTEEEASQFVWCNTYQNTKHGPKVFHHAKRIDLRNQEDEDEQVTLSIFVNYQSIAKRGNFYLLQCNYKDEDTDFRWQVLLSDYDIRLDTLANYIYKFDNCECSIGKSILKFLVEDLNLQELKLNFVDLGQARSELTFYVSPQLKEEYKVQYLANFIDTRDYGVYLSDYIDEEESECKCNSSECLEPALYAVDRNIAIVDRNGKYEFVKGFYVDGRFFGTEVLEENPLLLLYKEKELDIEKDYLLHIHYYKKSGYVKLTLCRNIAAFIKFKEYKGSFLEWYRNSVSKKYSTSGIVEYEVTTRQAVYALNKEIILAEMKKELEKKVRGIFRRFVRKEKENKTLETLVTTCQDLEVTREDSYAAGNCKPGTEDFIRKHFPGRNKVTVKELEPFFSKSMYVRNMVPILLEKAAREEDPA